MYLYIQHITGLNDAHKFNHIYNCVFVCHFSDIDWEGSCVDSCFPFLLFYHWCTIGLYIPDKRMLSFFRINKQSNENQPNPPPPHLLSSTPKNKYRVNWTNIMWIAVFLPNANLYQEMWEPQSHSRMNRIQNFICKDLIKFPIKLNVILIDSLMSWQ